MTVKELRQLFTRYVRKTDPYDLYDALGGELAFDEKGIEQWSFDDTLWRDGRCAVLTIRRYRIIDDLDKQKAEEWAKGFGEFAKVQFIESKTRILRDKGADYDIEVETRFSLAASTAKRAACADSQARPRLHVPWHAAGNRVYNSDGSLVTAVVLAGGEHIAARIAEAVNADVEIRRMLGVVSDE